MAAKLRAIHWDERSAASTNARRYLPPLVTEYFTYVRDTLAKNPPPPKLHALRLATKQLRYTLELFRACYGPGLETRLGELRHLQQLLGEVNDSAATERLLSSMMRASTQQLRVKKFLDERSATKAQAFREHWTGVFDAPGRERWWTGYLMREARAARR